MGRSLMKESERRKDLQRSILVGKTEHMHLSSSFQCNGYKAFRANAGNIGTPSFDHRYQLVWLRKDGHRYRVY